MSMDLAKQTFTYTPEFLIAGANIPITTGIKEAAADLKKGAPVILNASGKAAKVVVDNDEVVTTGLYGIVADDVTSGNDAVIYLTGEFYSDGLVLETGVTAADIEVPLRNLGIFLKGGEPTNP